MIVSWIVSRFPFLKTAFDPHFPFSPKQFPFFYGWVIAIVTTIGTLFSIPGQTAGVSVFTDHVIAATGLSRVEFSSAYTIGTLTSGLLLPFGGKLIDYLGARLTVIIASVGLGLTLVYLSFSDHFISVLNNFVPWGNRTSMGLIVMAVGFIALRFTGQGILTLVSRNTLGKWFNRRRGFVSGIANVFISFSFSAAPLLLSFWINGFGWRGAWLSLAMLVGMGMSLLGWLFYRDNPEVCGLRMDGDIGQSQDHESVESNVSHQNVAKVGELTAQQAIRTIEFWGVTLALSIHALTVTGITFHIVDLGQQAGLSEQQAVSLFLPIGILSTLTGFLAGVISDRVRLKWLVIVFLILQLAGFVGIAHLNLISWRIVGVAGLGTSGGVYAMLTTVALPRLFGRTHLGAIGGTQMTSMVIGSSLGPSLLALLEDMFGSYQQGLYTCCLLIPFALGLTLFSRE